MLGQPISMLLPQVIGFRLEGELGEAATATDLVLTVTEMLREKGVVAKFVEFYGPGLPSLGLADRATLGNMSPEFGSTCAIFPPDAETLRYLEFTGRPTETIELVEAYASEQGYFHTADSEDPTFSDTLELDLGDVVPSIAGPKRPQDRIALSDAKSAFLEMLAEYDDGDESLEGRDEASDESFPASDPPAHDNGGEREREGGPDRGRRHRRRRSRRAATPSRSPSRTGPRPTSTTAASSSPRSPAAPTPRTRGDDRRRAARQGARSRRARRASPGSRPRWRRARPSSPSTSPSPASTSTSTSSASTSSATAARPASATPGRCRRRSPKRSTSTTSSSPRCCRATATSRAGSTRT